MSLEKINRYKGKSSLSLNSVLGLVFITLKLCHVINWSWWWVTAPFWIPVALGIILIMALIFTGNTHKLAEELKKSAED